MKLFNLQTYAADEETLVEQPGDSVRRTAQRAPRRSPIRSRRHLPGCRWVAAWMQRSMFSLLRGAALINGLALIIILAFLVFHGWRAINWTFLTQPPADSMTKGGILPCIVGTFLLSFGAMLAAFPWGVASAIYLHEYARPGLILRVVRLGISNLAGIPSVVFGLFGLAFFVTWCNLGVSVLSGILTLGVLILPVIIGTAEEALAIGAGDLSRGFTGPGGHQVADHLPGGPAGRISRDADRLHSRHQPRRR